MSENARPLCGSCEACVARTNKLLRASGRPTLGPRLTAAALERHAKRFGPGQVPETAAEHGVDVSVDCPKAPRRGRGPSLRKRVAGYLADGHSVETIAELENLTPGRARRLVEELS